MKVDSGILLKKITEFKIVVLKDRPGILREISAILSRAKINILSISTNQLGKLPFIMMRCDINDSVKIEKLMVKIKKIKEVAEISYKLIDSAE